MDIYAEPIQPMQCDKSEQKTKIKTKLKLNLNIKHHKSKDNCLYNPNKLLIMVKELQEEN